MALVGHALGSSRHGWFEIGLIAAFFVGMLLLFFSKFVFFLLPITPCCGYYSPAFIY